MMQVGHGETVEHVRWLRNERNAHGQSRPVFADPVPIENVGVDVATVNEPRDGVTGRQIVDLVLFLPAGSSVNGQDQFIVRGDTYEVDGEAPAITNFFSGTPFLTEVKIKKVTG